ncbi:MAG: methyltransferase domain-containing protein [Lentisphaerae bacterium]|nr:methyltransferase domain-containing protein [Lentisphaerota bacterium]
MSNISDKLYCVKLTDYTANPDLTFELLSSLETYFSSYEDRESGAMYLVAYSETPEGGRELAERINACLPFWSEAGAIFSDVEEFELAREEWSEVWKKYFHIIHIADNLVIRPSWLKYTPQPGQAVVNIDPGMSFGTGQHATTAYCLKVLAQNAQKQEYKSVLDAGCGSGILAIAAKLLGYAPVTAYDYDPDCVSVTLENMQCNDLTTQDIDLFAADATTYAAPQEFDLACVNILSPILCAHAPRIISWVRKDGLLALAGILSQDFDNLSEIFTAAGAVELDRFTEKEWTSGLFRRVR